MVRTVLTLLIKMLFTIIHNAAKFGDVGLRPPLRGVNQSSFLSYLQHFKFGT